MTGASPTVRRLRSAAVCSLLTALAFAQEPGMTVVDTKVDLAVNPLGWLARATHLWNPTASFGEVQNQAYGYLWPMGPFFAAGAWLDMPAWVVQRLWWALLLCVAYTGIVTLACRLAIGTPAARMIAGVAFALSPRILTELGSISVEAWPSALAPWVLVPLVGLKSARGIVLSALVVCCAGGVNATAVFATVPLALLWFVHTRQFKRLLAWCAAVACATAWWLVPLLLLGRYSPPFLDYIETAAVTTRQADLMSVLRGTSHWLAYLGGPYGPQLPTGYRLAHEPLLFFATIAVAAIGIAGLSRRGLPHRRFLIAGLLFGAAVVTLGHASGLDNGLGTATRAFLDGPGAPLRNLHKFDVLLRLPLALGVAHLVGVFARAAAVHGRGWHLARRRAVVVASLVMASIAGVASPALAGTLTTPGSFVSVPQYWRDTAAWLNANAGQDHVLVVPAARFPHYLWGSPSDELTQPLLTVPWGVRSSIPLAPAGTIRLLDTIDGVLASGAGSPGLADLLARSDVRYLLLRSDLEHGKTGTARPMQVRQALRRSPGIELVRTFGPLLTPGPVLDDHYDHGLATAAHSLEIYQVRRPMKPAALYRASDVTTVVGGPESLLDMAAAGQLSSAPTVLAGDLGGWRPPGRITLTDGLRRREVAFGRSQDNASATLSAEDRFWLDTPAHDYLPSWGPKWTTDARYLGISSVTASSSWSWAQPLAGSRPEHHPFAALDGDPQTSWRTPPGQPAAGQWLEVTLAEPAPVRQVRLTFDRHSDHRPTKVTVFAGPDRVAGDVIGDSVTIDLPSGSITRKVRMVITEAVSTLRVGQGGVGIAEIEIPGVIASRTLVVPAGPRAGEPANVVLSAAPATPACFFVDRATRCHPDVARGSQDAGRIDRTVTLPAAGSYDVSLWAHPLPGLELDRLIEDEIASANPLGIVPSVNASSRLLEDPAGRPGAVVDGDPATAWYVGEGDSNPWLRIAWLAPRTVTGLRFALDPAVAATRPETITAVGADGTRGGIIDANGEVHFDRPMRTSELTILFHDSLPDRTLDPYSNTWRFLPLAVGEVTALPDPSASAADLDRRIELPCGSGPEIEAGREKIQTKLSGTLRDLLELRLLQASACSAQPLRLEAGQQRVVVGRSPIAAPATLALTTWSTRAEESPMEVLSWTAAERRLRVDVAGHDRVLVVRENTNPGWQAFIGGQRLPWLVLDGWQQGWTIPAGLGGEVVLTFTPDPAYRAAIFGGGGLALTLALVAVLPMRPQRGPMRRRAARWLALLVGALSLVAIAGVWSPLLAVGILPALFALRWLRGGLDSVDRRRLRLGMTAVRNWLPMVLVCLAGVVSWRSPDRHHDWLVQALALAAITALWLSALAGKHQLQRPLKHVVARRAKHQAAPKHEQKRADETAGEDVAAARPVDQRQHQRMPEEQSV